MSKMDEDLPGAVSPCHPRDYLTRIHERVHGKNNSHVHGSLEELHACTQRGLDEAEDAARFVANDAVHRPRHYNQHPSGVEAIVPCEHLGFNLGNAVKYLFRAGLKATEATDTDLRKARWYLARAAASNLRWQLAEDRPLHERAEQDQHMWTTVQTVRDADPNTVLGHVLTAYIDETLRTENPRVDAAMLAAFDRATEGKFTP